MVHTCILLMRMLNSYSYRHIHSHNRRLNKTKSKYNTSYNHNLNDSKSHLEPTIPNSSSEVMHDDTPLIAQWKRLKQQYPNYLLLFRVGDFFECLFQDAQRASQTLGTQLTTKSGKRTSVPMCGFPHFTLDTYLRKLVRAGWLVAIAEQVEHEQEQENDESYKNNTSVQKRKKKNNVAPPKIFERKVVRLVTPGTLVEEVLLNPKANNFIAAVHRDSENVVAISWLDISTGEWAITVCSVENLPHQLSRIGPAEILVTEQTQQELAKYFVGYYTTNRPVVQRLPKSLESILETDDSHRGVMHCLKNLSDSERRVTNMLLAYIDETQKSRIPQLTIPQRFTAAQFMSIDVTTRKALELTKPLSSTTRSASLLKSIDTCVTSQGSRLLSVRLTNPLLNCDEINDRLDTIHFFRLDDFLIENTRRLLRSFPDLERCVQRICLEKSEPRDIHSVLIALRNAGEMHATLVENIGTRLHEIPRSVDSLVASLNTVHLDELRQLLHDALIDPFPRMLGNRVIREGFDKQLDELRMLRDHSHQAVKQMETGLSMQMPGAKIRFTDSLGYFIEISAAKLGSLTVPSEFSLIHSTQSQFRYRTPDLDKLQYDISQAASKVARLESDLMYMLRQRIIACSSALLKIAHTVAIIDLSAAIAESSLQRSYCRPVILPAPTDKANVTFDISKGRHAVVEANMLYIQKRVKSHPSAENDIKNQTETFQDPRDAYDSLTESSVDDDSGLGSTNAAIVKNLQSPNELVVDFTPNNCHLEGPERTWLLVGANMSGKSCFLRQNALIAIMAQAGLYVPSESAKLSIVDQIFCRVGASDDIANAKSTFMLEMSEVANILCNATSHSLVVCDEVGRGSDLQNGLSLAWATLEHLSSVIGCRTIFATHYTELSSLAKVVPHISCYHMAVLVEAPPCSFDNDLSNSIQASMMPTVTFLHEVQAGGVTESHGIWVARLAGMPQQVIHRAQQLQMRLKEHARDLTMLVAEIISEDRNTPIEDGTGVENLHMTQIKLQEMQKQLESLNRTVDSLRKLEVDKMTPLEALQKLHEIQAHLLPVSS